jgi:hypothetical protein
MASKDMQQEYTNESGVNAWKIVLMTVGRAASHDAA